MLVLMVECRWVGMGYRTLLVRSIMWTSEQPKLRPLLNMEWVIKEKGSVETGTGKKGAMWNGSKDKSKLV